MLLYGVIVIVALAVRLAGLDQWPLTEVEANTALAAWRTVQGSTWRPAYYLPLLYDVYLVLFWFTLATDAATRILPALVGAGLVLLPYCARDLLGRKAALVAALLLALGPSWVYFLSRCRWSHPGHGRRRRPAALSLPRLPPVSSRAISASEP